MQRFIFIILLLSVLEQVYAQDSSLAGTYQIDLDKSVALMDSVTRQKYEGLESAVRTRAAQSMEGRGFVFKEGGQLEVRWRANGSEKITEGTWEMRDSVNLQITIGEQVTEYQVSRPNAKDLVIQNASGRNFFSTLYLARHE